MTAKWVAERYEDKIRANMSIPVHSLRLTMHEEYKIQISKTIARNAKGIAVDRIKGCAVEQYKHIWEYCEEIKKTRTNSTMVVEFTPFRDPGSNPRFMRLYCCLGALKEGFKMCRPVIGLDGCHIKGPYPAQLLSAVAVDPNNGLDRALSEVLPNSEHRYCVQHMYQNFKKKHPGKALKGMLWAIARSSTIEMYTKAAEDLKKYDNEACKWVEKAPHPMHWCKAYFSPHTKCDMIVNNLCESFNSHILEARDKPIISCLENIRELMMERIQKRKAAMTRYPHSTGPLIRKIIEDRIEESFQWFPQFNGIDGYQIYNNVLQPISRQVLWPESSMLQLDPPIPTVQPGRPKKARRRDETEGKNHGRKLRKNVTMHCRKCGKTGHNAAT
ncbi:uncharacterized protein [Coffea arabica]|uniref:Protein FAR1-RELATED SEQUENCE n=1 Tax=Coffea arabica TaxID=13443 RepID=A0ABM4UF17_COFAR